MIFKLSLDFCFLTFSAILLMQIAQKFIPSFSLHLHNSKNFNFRNCLLPLLRLCTFLSVFSLSCMSLSLFLFLLRLTSADEG